MQKLVKYLKPYYWQILGVIAFTYFQVMAALRLPDYMAKIINEGVVGGEKTAIFAYGLQMIFITFIGVVCTVIAGFFSSRVATGFARDLRREVFEKVESFSINEFNNFSTASLITRSTNDIQQMQMVLVMLLRIILVAPLTAIGALQKALANAPSMTWIIGIAVAILFGVVGILFWLGASRFKKVQELLDRLNLVTRENLIGIRVIRAFNNEKKEEERFEDTNKELTELTLFINRLMAVLQPVMLLTLNFSIIAIVWFAAHLISLGQIQIGNMIAFMQYAIQVITSFLMFSVIFIMLPRASVSGKRVAEVLETKPSVKDPEKPVKPNSGGSGKVEFRNVTFAYPGADVPVLTDINFTADPGKITAFIGSTGSGKTTLINLIPRFYDVTAGEILLDGVNIEKLKSSDLRRQIGYVPQKGVLFSGTVKSNVSFGRKGIGESEIKKAIEIAQASEFVDKSEHGLNSPIAEGGANISGGQKQRLSIARALAANPKVYIFDDSFSSLDFQTESKLRQALFSIMKGKTMLIVSQRLSAIMNADKIIVLNEGRIVGEGTHQELLKNNKIYQEIAYSQMPETKL